MLTQLTEEQKARMPFYVDKWTKIGLSTNAVDRPAAEISIKALYALAKLSEPRVEWYDDPIQGSNAAMDFAAKHSKNKEIIRDAGLSYFGGTLWAGYPAWADFFNVECNIELDRNYIDLHSNCGYYFCLDGLVIATEKPLKINLDEQGRLHNFNGKSIEYRSGWGLFHIHGIEVPGWIVKAPQKINNKTIDAEENIEVRRVMLDIYGADNYLKNGNYEVLDIDTDQFGRQRRLLRSQNGDDEPIVRVEVMNSTAEPDNCYKTYYLAVSSKLEPLFPGLTDTQVTEIEDQANEMSKEEKIEAGYLGKPQELTAHNAVASSFGLYGHEYGNNGQIRQGDVLLKFKDGSNNKPFRES